MVFKLSKKVLLSLVMCGTLFAPSVQAALTDAELEPIRKAMDGYSMYNKAAGLTEGADCVARGIRISTMVASKKPTDIKNMAMINMITSGLTIAAKLWFGGVINLNVIPNIFDLLRAKSITENATRIAKNNASRSKQSRKKLSDNRMLLGMLMAEGGTSAFSRFLKFRVDGDVTVNALRDISELIDQRDRGQVPQHEFERRSKELVEGSNLHHVILAAPIQLVSFILWIIRYNMEGKLLKKLMKKPSGSSNGDVAVDEKDNYDEIDDDDFEDDDDE